MALNHPSCGFLSGTKAWVHSITFPEHQQIVAVCPELLPGLFATAGVRATQRNLRHTLAGVARRLGGSVEELACEKGKMTSARHVGVVPLLVGSLFGVGVKGKPPGRVADVKARASDLAAVLSARACPCSGPAQTSAPSSPKCRLERKGKPKEATSSGGFETHTHTHWHMCVCVCVRVCVCLCSFHMLGFVCLLKGSFNMNLGMCSQLSGRLPSRCSIRRSAFFRKGLSPPVVPFYHFWGEGSPTKPY